MKERARTVDFRRAAESWARLAFDGDVLTAADGAARIKNIEKLSAIGSYPGESLMSSLRSAISVGRHVEWTMGAIGAGRVSMDEASGVPANPEQNGGRTLWGSLVDGSWVVVTESEWIPIGAVVKNERVSLLEGVVREEKKTAPIERRMVFARTVSEDGGGPFSVEFIVVEPRGFAEAVAKPDLRESGEWRWTTWREAVASFAEEVSSAKIFPGEKREQRPYRWAESVAESVFRVPIEELELVRELVHEAVSGKEPTEKETFLSKEAKAVLWSASTVAARKRLGDATAEPEGEILVRTVENARVP